MANVKNAKKKIKQINKTTLANQCLKSTVKNSIKNTDKVNEQLELISYVKEEVKDTTEEVPSQEQE